jgi:hypothetical protein
MMLGNLPNTLRHKLYGSFLPYTKIISRGIKVNIKVSRVHRVWKLVQTIHR